MLDPTNQLYLTYVAYLHDDQNEQVFFFAIYLRTKIFHPIDIV